MGTRSLTKVYEVDGSDAFMLVNIYRQFDGYPSGLGRDIAEFLEGRTVGNGIMLGADNSRFSNGADDLAAQLVVHLKQNLDPGNVYLMRPDEELDAGEEYEYRLYVERGKPVHVQVLDTYADEGKGENGVLFDGPADAFIEWVREEER